MLAMAWQAKCEHVLAEVGGRDADKGEVPGRFRKGHAAAAAAVGSNGLCFSM